jgi:transglutaminase-like putative cysteine protease
LQPQIAIRPVSVGLPIPLKIVAKSGETTGSRSSSIFSVNFSLVIVARSPMDFSARFEVHLGDRWWTFDARHNIRRIGRVLMATGRDTTDCAIKRHLEEYV